MKLKAFLPEAWTQFRALFRKFVKKTFTGTKAEWDALTTAEKQEYDICNLTDDLASGELIVSDAVTAGDLNPVTSNAVANYALAKSDAGKFTDLGSFGTLDAAGASMYTNALANISSGNSGLYCINVTDIGYLFGRVYRIGSEAHGIFTVQENGNSIKRIYSWSKWSNIYSGRYWGYVELTNA